MGKGKKECPQLEEKMISLLKPNIQRKIWGGIKLAGLKGIKEDQSFKENIGETWEISNHKDGPALLNGKELSSSMDLSYLVKLIDTSDELSVQVHPGDEYAKAHENSLGKSECWLILSAEKNAGIYLGLKKGVTKESFLKGLEAKKQMNEYLNFYEVSPGDFFYVPAGSIHAIGRGITLAEVQQNSGITYRVWDWNRVDSAGKPRELHVQKSLDVINFNEAANSKDHFQVKHNLFKTKGVHSLIKHEAFDFQLINLAANEALKVSLNSDKRAKSILNLGESITVNETILKPYEAALIENEKVLEVSAQHSAQFVLIQ